MLLFDLVALLVVTVLGVCCWYFRISHKYVIASGLLLLLLAGGVALGGLAEAANDTSVAAFFVLAVGIVLAGITRPQDQSARGLPIPLTESALGEDKPKRA